MLATISSSQRASDGLMQEKLKLAIIREAAPLCATPHQPSVACHLVLEEIQALFICRGRISTLVKDYRTRVETKKNKKILPMC